MQITTEGDTTTVCLRGRLVVGQTEALEGKLKQMMPTHKTIVLDLGGLNQIDSTGLGSLVSLCLTGKTDRLPDRTEEPHQADQGSAQPDEYAFALRHLRRKEQGRQRRLIRLAPGDRTHSRSVVLPRPDAQAVCTTSSYNKPS